MSQQPPGQILCPNCRGGNPPDATQCQWCKAPLQVQQAESQYPQSYPQRQPTTVIVQQKKNPPWLLIILGVVGLCGLSCIGAIYFSGLALQSGVRAFATSIPTSFTADAATAEAIESLPADSASPVGSSQQTGGLRVTLNEVRRSAEGQFGKADSGRENLILNFTIENTDPTIESSFDSYYITVKDDSGQEYDPTHIADTQLSLDSPIEPGDRITGDLAYEVSKDATGLVFIYNPSSPLFGDPIRFKLDK